MNTRRDFLRDSMLLGAATAIAGCAAERFGSTGAGGPMFGYADKPMDRIRVGFVGVGKRGYAAYRRCAWLIPYLDATAVCDVDDWKCDRCEQFAIDHGLNPPKKYVGPEAYKALCGDSDVDVVYNIASREVHLPVNLCGMRAGKHVMTEVPGAMTVDGCWETVETAAIVGVLGGILTALVGLILSVPMLRVMSTPENVLPLAAVYLRIYFLGIPFLATYNFLSAVLRSVGDTRRPLLYMAVAGVVNVLLNLLLVVVFHLGVVGVAVATVASELLSCILTVRCLLLSEGAYRLPRGKLHFSRTVFLQMLHIGLPAGIQGSLFSISNVIIQSSINSFGASVVAGNAAAASLEGFGYCCQDSVCQATVAAASQCMGARKYERVRSVTVVCNILAVFASMVPYGVILLFRHPLLHAYTAEADAVEAGVVRLFYLGSLYFTAGFMGVMTGVLRGYGYSILPTSITLVGVCGFRLVWIFTVFARFHDLRLLYSCYPISWTLTAIGLFIAYFALRKKAVALNEARYRAEQAAE